MKKEVFIMHDFKALCRQAHTLVIFKSLHEVPVFEKLLDTLAVCESDSDMMCAEIFRKIEHEIRNAQLTCNASCVLHVI